MRIRQLVAAATCLLVGATGLVVAGSAAGASAAVVPPRRIVSGWLPYWTPTASTAALIANKDLFTDASPFWHSATSSTVVVNQASASTVTSMVGQLHLAGIRVLPTVTDGLPAHGMAAVLASSTSRAAHVATLVNLVLARGYDGIDLDYEKFAFSDGSATWPTTRPNWVAFVAQLSAALHAHGKLLSVTTPAIYNASHAAGSGYWVYDWKGIAPYADRVRIMTYDYSFSAAGPIAPISWVDAVAAFAVTQVPSGKIQLGVPTYGYDWAGARVGVCPSSNLPPAKKEYSSAGAIALAASLHITPTWNAAYGESTFSYPATYTGSGVSGGTTTCKVTRTVWFGNAASVDLRTRLVGKYQLGGVAFWTIGGEDPTQWARIRAYAQTIAPDPTVTPIYVSATSVPVGSVLTVSTRVSRVNRGTYDEGARVYLWARHYGRTTTWFPVGMFHTDANGRAGTTVGMSTGMQFQWTTRAGWDNLASNSAVVSVPVR